MRLATANLVVRIVQYASINIAGGRESQSLAATST